MAALTSLMTRFCAGKDNWLARCSTSDPSTSEVRDGNGKSRRNSNNKRRNKGDNTKNTAVNAGFKSSRLGQQKPPSKGARDELSSLNKILDQICQVHSTPGKPANHTHRECWVFKQSGKLNAVHKGEDTPSEDEDEPLKQDTGEQKKFPPEVKTVNVLHVIKGKTTWHSQENIPKCLSPRSPATGRLNRSLSTIAITQQVSDTQDGLPWY